MRARVRNSGALVGKTARVRLIGLGALLTAVYLAFLIAWAYTVPALRSPDAPMHYNSVMRLVNGGGWPAPGEASIDPAVRTIAIEGGLTPAAAPDVGLVHFYRLDGGLIYGNGTHFSDLMPLPEDERTIPAFSRGSIGVDQMTQHPPLYYGIAAGYLTLLGAEDWQWDGQLLALRILSALMVVWIVPCAIYTARRLGLSPHLSLLAGAALFAVPQLAHIGSSITNDSLYILTGSLLTAACAKVVTSAPTVRDVLMTGVLLGIGLWTKATFAPFGIVVVLSFLLSTGRKRLVYGTAAALLGAAISAYWWIRNIVLYGSIQPAGLPTKPFDWAGEEPSPAHFFSHALSDLVSSFWGKFGWLELPLPTALIVALTVCAAAMAGTGIIASRSRRPALVTLTLYVPITAAILLAQGWMNYLHTGNVAGMQGRYLFPGIAALAVLAVWGVVWLGEVGGERLARAGGAALAFSPLIGLFGLWMMLRAAYPDESLLGFSWVMWDAWSIATGATLKIWVGLCVVGSAAVIAAGVRQALSSRAAPSTLTQGSGQRIDRRGGPEGRGTQRVR